MGILETTRTVPFPARISSYVSREYLSLLTTWKISSSHPSKVSGHEGQRTKLKLIIFFASGLCNILILAGSGIMQVYHIGEWKLIPTLFGLVKTD